MLPLYFSLIIAISNVFLIGVAIYSKQMDIINVFNTTSDYYMDTGGNDKTIIFYSLDSLADYLDDNAPNATVYARYELSNYFEYRGYKIFTDARPELYVKEICGNDDLSVLYFDIKNGYDTISLYRNRSKNLVNYALTYGLGKEEYVLSYEEYGRAVDSVNADYYVVDVTFNQSLYHYLENSTDKYEFVATSDQYYMFKRI